MPRRLIKACRPYARVEIGRYSSSAGGQNLPWAALRSLLEGRGEFLERGLQIGNRPFDQRRKQAAKRLGHAELHCAVATLRERESPLALEKAERHAACPDHLLSWNEPGDLDWKGAARAELGVDGYFFAGGDAALNLFDGLVPRCVFRSVGENLPDSAGASAYRGRGLERFHRHHGNITVTVPPRPPARPPRSFRTPERAETTDPRFPAWSGDGRSPVCLDSLK